MFQVTVLISGRGSNMLSLLKNQSSYKISAVLSDKPEAEGLKLAQQANVAVVESFPREKFKTKLEQKNAIYSRIMALNPDLICLAGFMQIVEESFVRDFYGKLINIHPSLLPEFTGLNTHARALEAGVAQHGCSVHYVDTGLDTGPVIAQAKCDVLKTDNETSLTARVLELEHRLYPWVVNSIAEKSIYLKTDRESSASKVFISENKLKEAQKNNFIT